MQLLRGKRILVMGLLDTRSTAWAIGQLATEHGAEVTYTVQSERFRNSLLRRSFKQDGLNVDDYQIRPCDVTKVDEVRELFFDSDGLVSQRLHGLVHSIGYANPKTCLGGSIFGAPSDDILYALNVSALSLITVLEFARQAMEPGGSVVTLTFDSQHAWPEYNWMGVCKSALEACVRMAARELGPQQIRVNALSAGPMQTIAASAIPGFAEIDSVWPERAPLSWDSAIDRSAVAGAALWLLSDLASKTTGHTLPVDGGFQIAAIPNPSKV